MDKFYLEGYIYHMVHFSNLESILRRRALLSKERIRSENLTYISIANDDVQDLRDRVYVWDRQSPPRSLHTYVPFYFAKRTPMLYVQYRNSLQSEIVFLEINRTIIADEGVIFTNGNATIQQLAKSGKEIVLIAPATMEIPVCIRVYSSGSPQGTNSNCSDFYKGTAFLEKLDWLMIENNVWGRNAEKKRIKHAEVLVPDIVPLSKIEGISIFNQAKADNVNMLIRRYRLERHIPRAVSRPKLYF